MTIKRRFRGHGMLRESNLKETIQKYKELNENFIFLSRINFRNNEIAVIVLINLKN